MCTPAYIFPSQLKFLNLHIALLTYKIFLSYHITFSEIWNMKYKHKGILQIWMKKLWLVFKFYNNLIFCVNEENVVNSICCVVFLYTAATAAEFLLRKPAK